jgi:chromosome segregation ATPase
MRWVWCLFASDPDGNSCSGEATEEAVKLRDRLVEMEMEVEHVRRQGEADKESLERVAEGLKARIQELEGEVEAQVKEGEKSVAEARRQAEEGAAAAKEELRRQREEAKDVVAELEAVRAEEERLRGMLASLQEQCDKEAVEVCHITHPTSFIFHCEICQIGIDRWGSHRIGSCSIY